MGSKGKTSPTKSSPAKSSPAKSAPAKSAPAKSAPAKSAPAKSAPAKSAPASGSTVSVGSNGKAPAGLSVGTTVSTGGGNYKITGVNSDGSYRSEKVTSGGSSTTSGGATQSSSGSSGSSSGGSSGNNFSALWGNNPTPATTTSGGTSGGGTSISQQIASLKKDAITPEMVKNNTSNDAYLGVTQDGGKVLNPYGFGNYVYTDPTGRKSVVGAAQAQQMLKNAATQGAQLGDRLTQISADNSYTDGQGNRAVKIGDNLVNYMSGGSGYFTPQAGTQFTNAAGQTITSNGKFLDGINMGDLTGSKLIDPTGQYSQNINNAADSRNAYFAMNDIIARGNTGFNPAGAAAPFSANLTPPTMSQSAPLYGGLTGDAGGVTGAEFRGAQPVQQGFNSIMQTIKAGGQPAINTFNSEIARAQKVYAEAQQSGDTTRAQQAHAYANTLRNAMGVSGNYDQNTGAMKQQGAGQGVFGGGGQGGAGGVSYGESTVSSGNMSALAGVKQALESGDMGALMNIVDSLDDSANNTQENDDYIRRRDDLLSQMGNMSDIDIEGDMDKYIEKVMSGNQDYINSQQGTLQKQFDTERSQAQAQADARGMFYSGSLGEEMGNISNRQANAMGDLIANLRKDATSQAAQFMDSKLQQINMNRQTLASMLEALQGDHQLAQQLGADRAKRLQDNLLAIAGLQQKRQELAANQQSDAAKLKQEADLTKLGLQNNLDIARMNNASRGGGSGGGGGGMTANQALQWQVMAQQQADSQKQAAWQIIADYQQKNPGKFIGGSNSKAGIQEVARNLYYAGVGVTDMNQAMQIATEAYNAARAQLPRAAATKTPSRSGNGMTKQALVATASKAKTK